MGKPQNTVNCGIFVGQGGQRLSPTEKKELPYGNAWAPGRISELTLTAGSAGLLPSISSQCGLESY